MSLPQFDLVLRIFISYSRQDKPFVDVIKDHLSGLTQSAVSATNLMEVWYDQDNIKPSTHFHEEIIKGLTSVDRIVLVMSNKSLESSYVYTEFKFADEHNITVIPLLYQVDESTLIGEGKEFYTKIAKVIHWISLADIEAPFVQHPGIASLEQSLEAAWIGKIEKQRQALAQLQHERKLIADLSKFDHLWVIRYLSGQVRDLVLHYQPDKATYYLCGLLNMKSDEAKQAVETLTNWWRTEVSPSQTHLLEYTLRHPCPSTF